MSGKICVLLLCPVLFLFAACAPRMAQEEARQIAVLTDTAAAIPVAPPRSIADILDILDQPGISDPEVIEWLRIEAEAPQPSIPSDTYLAEFHHRRAGASESLGHGRKALEDARTAFLHMQKAGEERLDIMRNLAHLEKDFGSRRRALELLQRCRDLDAVLPLPQYAVSYDQLLLDLHLSAGDIEAAEKAYEKAAEFCRNKMGNASGRYLDVRLAPGEILQRERRCESMEAKFAESRNRHREAESSWRRHLAVCLKSARNPGRIVSARLSLAANLRHQGRLLEAEMESRKALSEALGYGGKESTRLGQALRNLGKTLQDQGRLAEAEKLARTGIRIYEKSGLSEDSSQMLEERMFYGDVLVRKEKYPEAREQYDLLREAGKRNPENFKKTFANPPAILTLIKTGAVREALELIPAAYESRARIHGEDDSRTARIVGLRAMAYAANGEDRKAFADFSVALPNLAGKEEKFVPLAILDAYIHFLGRIHNTPVEKDLGIDAPAEAFAVAGLIDRDATGTALREACARLAILSDPALEALAGRERDLLARIDALETAVSDHLSLPAAEQDRAAISRYILAIGQLKKERESIRNEIAGKSPGYRDFIKPPSVSLETAQKNLRPGEALVFIYPSERKTFIWAVPQRGKTSFAISDAGKESLAAAVNDIRKALDIHPRTLGDIPAFDAAKAHELYRTLLKPVESGWKDASDLIVVAQGPLRLLPLTVLPTEETASVEHKRELFGGYRDVPWLIRRVSVTTVPSVASLIGLRALPAGDPRRKAFAGFGDPLFNREQYARAAAAGEAAAAQPAGTGIAVATRGIRISGKENLDSDRIRSSRLESLDRLPDTAAEIAGIATILGADQRKDVFYGKDASERLVKTMPLADRKVIAFATHALVPRDLDGLEQPALALSSPAVTGEKEDGLLTMEEILRLKLNADWVVLSGCNTGAAGGAGAEAVSGLGGAFFYAGARALLVSMWPVETTSGRKLVTGIFEAQKAERISRAQAVRRSMLELLDRGTLIEEASGKIAASYAHPFFWAPFVMVGDPGVAP